jgi:hypothetical protein
MIKKPTTVTGTRKAAGFQALVMAVRNRWAGRTRGYRSPVVVSVDDNDRYITIGMAVPDSGPQARDEDMTAHVTHAVLTAVDGEICRWWIEEIEDPDLGEMWKIYDDWDWRSPLVYVN